MDSLPVKELDNKITDIENVMKGMRDKINVLESCLKTSDVVINELSKGNQRLTEAVELGVDQIPTFKPLIGFIEDLDEAIGREKDNLETMKASMALKTNVGHDVEQLIRDLRQCALKNEPMDEHKSETINESLNNDQSFGDDYERTVKSESTANWVETTAAEDAISDSQSVVPVVDIVSSDSECEMTGNASVGGGARQAIDSADETEVSDEESDRKSLVTSEPPMTTASVAHKQRRLWRRVVSGGRNGGPKYVCLWPECGYETRKSSDMTCHASRHRNERQHKCRTNGCRFRANLLKDLKIHQRRHKDDPEYRYDSNRSYSRLASTSSQ